LAAALLAALLPALASRLLLLLSGLLLAAAALLLLSGLLLATLLLLTTLALIRICHEFLLRDDSRGPRTRLAKGKFPCSVGKLSLQPPCAASAKELCAMKN
jgi:hypothetical protein